MENNFPKILRELREKAGFESQTKFAEACGVDNSTIARLERGETKPTPQTIMKLAPVLGVSLIELMVAAGYVEDRIRMERGSDKPLYLTKEGLNAFNLKEVEPLYLREKEIGTPCFLEKVIEVPILGTIKAGYNHVAEQEIIGYEYVSNRRLKEGEYFFLQVTGDSMIDAGIREGCRVLVRHQNFVEQGKIGVVLINGEEATLKRVYYQNSHVILQSENAQKKYPPQVFRVEDILIQGQVTRVEFDV